MRYFFNSLLLFFLVLFCVSCDGYGANIFCIGILVALFCLGVFVFGVTTLSKKEDKERMERYRRDGEAIMAKQMAEQSALDVKIQTYASERAKLIEVLGEPDKTIILDSYNLDREIRAYSTLRKVSILGKTYEFESIMSCDVSDNSRIEKGQTIITSTGTAKVDNGNMLGRTVVGGLVAGGVGAVIGGSTAKKSSTMTSVVEHGSNYTRHNYTVWISVKDIANPLVQITTGDNTAKTNEIVALMNAIIASKES